MKTVTWKKKHKKKKKIRLAKFRLVGGKFVMQRMEFKVRSHKYIILEIEQHSKDATLP